MKKISRGVCGLVVLLMGACSSGPRTLEEGGASVTTEADQKALRQGDTMDDNPSSNTIINPYQAKPQK